MSLFGDLKKLGEQALKDIASDELKEKAKSLLDSANEAVEAGKKALNELNTEENKEKAKDFFGDLGNKLGSIIDNEEEKADKEQVIIADDGDDSTCEEKLLKVLKEEFSSYTVRRNVSPKELGGEGKFMDYSIVVYDGAKPKLVIMLIGKTTCSHREYRFSKAYAESIGVELINFIVHYPNNTEYIKNRLHKYL